MRRETDEGEIGDEAYRARTKKSIGEAIHALEHHGGLAEVRAGLDALLAALSRHGDRLNDPEPVFALTAHVAEELKRKSPDRHTLKTILVGIAEEAKSVGEILVPVLSLKDTVMAVFP
jgi:hypothetical protein